MQYMPTMATKKPPQKPKGVLPPRPMPDYGVKWATPQKSPLSQELALFRNPFGSQVIAKDKNGVSRVVKTFKDGTPTKGKPRWYHFMQIVDILWNYQGSTKPFVWHPDAIRMLKAACKYKRLGVAGAGSTGKSDFFAIWAIINFLSNPAPYSITGQNGEIFPQSGAMILVTSTTKGAANNRIWGKVISYWNAIIAPVCGKLMASEYLICYHNLQTGETDRTCGIKLVAGEAKQEAKSADEIRGVKGDPIILVIDEHPECGHSLVNTFDENLSRNHNCQLIGLGNPGTYFDAFGDLCEPETGWESVGDDDYDWNSRKGGHVIRLDAELSPNILEGKVIYNFLMTQQQMEDTIRREGGRNTPAYYRGVRGMWCSATAEQTIYTQGDLLFSNAFKPAVWRGEWTMVAGFDVSFTHDGDRSILYFAKIGMSVEGRLTVEFQNFVEINEDTRIKDIDRTTQIVRKLRDECEKQGVLPENLAIDASGPGGKAFRDAIISQWTSKFLSVDFSGAPSDKPVSKMEPNVKCRDRYDRRVSEIWYAGKSLLRGDQLRGIGKPMAAEMVTRKYRETKPMAKDNKIIVETKREMKGRTKTSPDVVDASFICLQLCITRHKLISDDKPADRKEPGAPNPIKKRFSALQGIYAA